MIFLVQFGKNKHLLVFFIPNCTRNHVINYNNFFTYLMLLQIFGHKNFDILRKGKMFKTRITVKKLISYLPIP